MKDLNKSRRQSIQCRDSCRLRIACRAFVEGQEPAQFSAENSMWAQSASQGLNMGRKRPASGQGHRCGQEYVLGGIQQGQNQDSFSAVSEVYAQAYL